jgi:hypothetical protein
MKFPTSMFDWTPEDGLFSQELSLLGVGPRVNAFHQLYNDACDEGITLISDTTGKEADYYVDNIDWMNEFTEDREIAGWKLLPTPETVRTHPRLKNTRVLLIND